MPLYDFKCERGHVFEKIVPVEQFDFAQQCPVLACGALAHQLWLKVPGMFTPDSAAVTDDRDAYFHHNVTREGSTEDGTVISHPNSHSMQCQCEKCCRHRKRALVTETADHGKDAAYGL